LLLLSPILLFFFSLLIFLLHRPAADRPSLPGPAGGLSPRPRLGLFADWSGLSFRFCRRHFGRFAGNPSPGTDRSASDRSYRRKRALEPDWTCQNRVIW